jgi:hypothetical protein
MGALAATAVRRLSQPWYRDMRHDLAVTVVRQVSRSEPQAGNTRPSRGPLPRRVPALTNLTGVFSMTNRFESYVVRSVEAKGSAGVIA